MNLDWRRQQNVVITITPQMAVEWLERHNTTNRDRKPSVVSQYARDLLAGRWPVTHQGIAFDWNGELIDGQHRLAAIALANVSVQMYVATGLDPLARSVVDTQAKRSVYDAFTLSGRKMDYGSVGPNTAAGMWGRMMLGVQTQKGKATRQELLVFSDLYHEAGEWALLEFGKHPRCKSVHVVSVIAAVARAYYAYQADLYRLSQFVEVLCTGLTRSPEDNTAVHLRNALSNSPSMRGNSNLQPELYGKTARAIQAFMQREILRIFRSYDREPFPLPDRGSAETVGGPRGVVGDVGRVGTGRRGIA